MKLDSISTVNDLKRILDLLRKDLLRMGFAAAHADAMVLEIVKASLKG